MSPNRPDHSTLNESIIVVSVLLVAAGLIGIGALNAKLLLIALPVAALLLLLLSHRSPLARTAASGPERADGSRQAGTAGSRPGGLQLVGGREADDRREGGHERPHAHPLHARALETVAAADKDIRHLRKIADRLDDPRVSDSIRELCGMAEAIGGNVKADPGILPSVQRFYDYYLRTAKMLWSQYEVLVRSPFYNKEMEFQVKRIENLLEPLHRNFERHLARSMRGELSRVELEVNTLERVMRSEG